MSRSRCPGIPVENLQAPYPPAGPGKSPDGQLDVLLELLVQFLGGGGGPGRRRVLLDEVDGVKKARRLVGVALDRYQLLPGQPFGRPGQEVVG